MWLHSLKVAQLLRSAACLHTNQSRSYLNHLVKAVGVSKSVLANIFEDACPYFEEILSRDHGNFEEQNKVLENEVIISYCILVIMKAC